MRYVGPIDGHDIAAMENALRNASEFDGPVVFARADAEGPRLSAHRRTTTRSTLHDAPVFDLLTGPPKSAPSGYTQAFAEAVVKERAEDRPNLVAIAAAMPGPTGLLAFADHFPDRFFDVGIAETARWPAAAGMAMGGLRPVVAIYSTFLNRASTKVVYDVALHKLPVVFCLDRAGVTGDDGPSHHGIYDMALLSKVPGMTVLAPSSSDNLQRCCTRSNSATAPSSSATRRARPARWATTN